MNKVFILRSKVNAQALWAFLKANWEACAEAGRPLQITITPEVTKRSLELDLLTFAPSISWAAS